MSQVVDLSEFYTSTKGACKTAKLIEKLSEAEKTKFEAALAEPKISVASISKWLADKTGEIVKDPTTRLHRLGKCACE
jgi:thymidine kinase